MIGDIDQQAFELAIATARDEDAGRCRQIDDMLRERPFEEVGRFASYHCQTRSLALPPWAYPPCMIDITAVGKILAAGDNDIHGRFVAAKLVQRLLDLGLSRFHPDPLAAIDAAKRGAAA
jgi:hypothetical protein